MWWGGNREFRKETWGCRAPFREEEIASDQVLTPKYTCNPLLFWSSLLPPESTPPSFLAIMTALDWALQFYPHSHPFFSTKVWKQFLKCKNYVFTQLKLSSSFSLHPPHYVESIEFRDYKDPLGMVPAFLTMLIQCVALLPKLSLSICGTHDARLLLHFISLWPPDQYRTLFLKYLWYFWSKHKSHLLREALHDCAMESGSHSYSVIASQVTVDHVVLLS